MSYVQLILSEIAHFTVSHSAVELFIRKIQVSVAYNATQNISVFDKYVTMNFSTKQHHVMWHINAVTVAVSDMNGVQW